MRPRTPARLYALVAGASLTAGGIAGFFSSSAFGTPGKTRDVFDLLSVNGWHNVVHLGSGLLGLLAARRATTARGFAATFGLVYLVVAVWGFAIGSGQAILSVIPVNTADNILHVALGLLGLGAAVASHEHPATAHALTP